MTDQKDPPPEGTGSAQLDPEYAEHVERAATPATRDLPAVRPAIVVPADVTPLTRIAVLEANGPLVVSRTLPIPGVTPPGGGGGSPNPPVSVGTPSPASPSPKISGQKRIGNVTFLMLSPQALDTFPEAHAQWMEALHALVRPYLERIHREGEDERARAFTSATGIILFTERVYPSWFLGELSSRVAEAGIPIRGGASHGPVYFFSDLDGSENALGERVNAAARLARSRENPGFLFDRHAIEKLEPVPEKWLPASLDVDKDFLTVKGKHVEEVYRCRRAKNFSTAVDVRAPGAKVSGVNALFVCYDLKDFSRGGDDDIVARFQRMVQGVESTLRWARGTTPFFLPGGDGGLLAFPVDGPNATEVAIGVQQFAEQLNQQLAAHSLKGDLAERIRCGIHEGSVHRWTDIHMTVRPGGKAVLETEILTESYEPPAFSVSSTAWSHMGSVFRWTHRDAPSKPKEPRSHALVVPENRRVVDPVKSMQRYLQAVREILELTRNGTAPQRFLDVIDQTFQKEARVGLRHAILDSLLTLQVFFWSSWVVFMYRKIYLPGGGDSAAAATLGKDIDGPELTRWVLSPLAEHGAWWVAAALTIAGAGTLFGYLCRWVYRTFMYFVLHNLEVSEDKRKEWYTWLVPVWRKVRERFQSGNRDEPSISRKGEAKFENRWSLAPWAAASFALVGNLLMFVIFCLLLPRISRDPPAGAAFWTQLSGPHEGTGWADLWPAAVCALAAGVGWAGLFFCRLMRIDWSPLYLDKDRRVQNRKRSLRGWGFFRTTAVGMLIYTTVVAVVGAGVIAACLAVARSRSGWPQGDLYDWFKGLFPIYLAVMFSILVTGLWVLTSRDDDRRIQSFVQRVLSTRHAAPAYLGPITARMWDEMHAREEFDEINALAAHVTGLSPRTCWVVVDVDDRYQEKVKEILVLSPEVRDMFADWKYDESRIEKLRATEIFHEPYRVAIRTALQEAARVNKGKSPQEYRAELQDGRSVKVRVAIPTPEVRRRVLLWWEWDTDPASQ